jgi:hypothetical protein
MPRANRIEKRGNPILNDHFILCMSRLSKVKTILEPSAASASHRHADTAVFHSRSFHDLLNHGDRSVSKSEQRFLCATEVSAL